MHPLDSYTATSGRLVPVYRITINTRPDDAARLLDAVHAVHPLDVGQYRRNATLTAPGAETGRPGAQTVTRLHQDDFPADGTENYPSVELKIAIERDVAVLQRVMDAILDAHQYEEPTVHVREEWASRAAYSTDNTNPNRWWNDGRGTPGMVPFGEGDVPPRP